MEGFYYHDLFSTKGIEYVLVMIFLGAFVIFSYLTFRAAKGSQVVTSEKRRLMYPLFKIPENMYYHRGHSWVFPEGEKLARIGIDDFAQKLIGKIDEIRIPRIGEELSQGDVAMTLVVDGKEIKMLSPVDGEIIDVNESVLRDPEKIMRDPYGEGWLLRAYCPNLESNLKNLLPGRLAARWIDIVRESLFPKVEYNLGAVLQDGGVPISGMAKQIFPDSWDEVVKEHFLTKDA